MTSPPAPGAGLQIAQLPAGEALAGLGSGPSGLTTSEAARRRLEFGPNQVEAVARTPLWMALAKEFTHFFALLLGLAAALAFVADWFSPDSGMQQLGVAIVLVILVNGLFSFWQAHRAERALAALRELLPRQVQILREGRTVSEQASAIVPGDVLLLVEGSQVPADCRIVEAWALRVNMATLTGEALPNARVAEPDPQARDPLTARNILLAGTMVLSGECRAVAYATGMRTEFGRIAHLTQTAGETESPLQAEIRRVSRVIAGIALALGLVFFVVGQVIELSFWDNALFAIGIIVANVPEGLLPTVTLALALATQRMARRNALVRHLPAVEALGSATVVLTDKTGTLTENRMTVTEVHPGLPAGSPGTARATRLREVARRCQSLKFPDGEPAGDPMEVALWRFAGPGVSEPIVAELPFEAERRRMSVATRAADGSVRLWCKGAPENVLPCCATWLDGDVPRPLDAAARSEFERAQTRMADRGLRVLALAWRPLADGTAAAEEQLELCGLVGLEDPPRPDVPRAVERCREAGVRVIMITGDHPHTAAAIARQIGLIGADAPRVVLGEDVRRMPAAELQLALDSPEVLFARVTAEQKMLIVQALQHKGHIVAVTGDGVNDAPALKTADIGIAMGRCGTDVAREAADIVLLDDHFATIVNAIEEGRAVFENIGKFLTYILTSNIPELVPYLAFVIWRIPLPLTVIQILAVDLGTDMVPALALGAEPPHADVMRRPPQARGERLLSGRLLARAYLFLGPLEAVAGMAAYGYVLHVGGWQAGIPLGSRAPLYLAATTATLGAIVLAQVVNVFVCRHPSLPAWRFRPAPSRLLLVGVAAELVLLAVLVYTPIGQAFFGTAPLGGDTWLYMVPFALGLGVAEEVRKGLVRKLARPRGGPGAGERAGEARSGANGHTGGGHQRAKRDQLDVPFPGTPPPD